MSNAPRRALLVGAVVSLLLAACSSLGIGAPAPAALDGRTFLSTKVMQGGADRPLVAGSRIRLSFRADGGLGVSAGCNSIGGSYTLTGGVLTFTGGGMTDMACAEPLMTQDTWLVDLLSKGPALTLVGNDLTLTAGDTVIALLDRKVAEPDLPLVGPRWTLVTILDGQTASSVPVTATLVFGADGHVTLDTGCNTGGATVRQDGATLGFSEVVTTKRACVAGGDVETKLLQVLRADSVQWSVDASILSLRIATLGLDFQGS